MSTQYRPAVIGWISVAAVVASTDIFVIRRGACTMSRAYRDAYKSHPLIVGGATAYLIAHLTGWCPPRLDVLSNLR